MDLFSLLKVKQRDADTMDLWLTNSFLLPITVMNASLSHNLQGALKVFTTAASNVGNSGYMFSTRRRLDILPSAAAAGRDVVSDAPCVLGDELQRCVDSSSGVLVPSVPAAAQHDPTCQSAVCVEPVHQPGHSPAHSFLLLLHPVHGEQPAIVEFKGLEIDGCP